MSGPETISAYVQLATLLAIAVFTFINTMRSKKAAIVAEKAAVAADKAAIVSEKIHTLVNSNMGIQLRVNMLQARRIAAMTKKKEDKELAIESERLYHAHQTKQAAVDKQEKQATETG